MNDRYHRFGQSLFVFLALFLFFTLMPSFTVQASGLSRDGFLRLYHSHLNDFLEIAYEKDGVPDPAALQKLNHFLRSRDSNEVREMDLELIRLIDHLQDHFKADTVEVICSYRTAQYNANLKKQGRNVAENSNHIRGIAADIHFDEITENALQRYARSLGKGGVGYYPDLNMVHVDMGWVHFWQEEKFSNRRDIGVFNNAVPVKLTTHQLFYFSGKDQTLELRNPHHLSLKPVLDLEWFSRGQWKKIGSVNLTDPDWGAQSPQSAHLELPLKGLDTRTPTLKNWAQNERLEIPYGKFRWKLALSDGREQYSNEFYLKKK